MLHTVWTLVALCGMTMAYWYNKVVAAMAYSMGRTLIEGGREHERRVKQLRVRGEAAMRRLRVPPWAG